MNHEQNCDCDICFADELERVAEAFREIRLNKSPLASLPGWERAVHEHVGQDRANQDRTGCDQAEISAPD